MRIDPASDIGLHYREADAGEVECRHGQHQKQPLQCLGRLQFARLDLKATRFVIQKGLFNGMITNDKFCCTRRSTLHLSWWRRPLRLRQ